MIFKLLFYLHPKPPITMFTLRFLITLFYLFSSSWMQHNSLLMSRLGVSINITLFKQFKTLTHHENIHFNFDDKHLFHQSIVRAI